MIRSSLEKLFSQLSPEAKRKLFSEGFWWAVLILLAGITWLWLRRRPAPTTFQEYEADRVRREGIARSTRPQKGVSDPRGTQADALAQARYRKPQARLLLEGISIRGAPHEVLGIAPTASPEEIQKAYKNLMKRYHPDRVGRPDSQEWKDAMEIAEALNRAKSEMLARASSRPKA
jgi:hypothetical protein